MDDIASARAYLDDMTVPISLYIELLELAEEAEGHVEQLEQSLARNHAETRSLQQVAGRFEEIASTNHPGDTCWDDIARIVTGRVPDPGKPIHPRMILDYIKGLPGIGTGDASS